MCLKSVKDDKEDDSNWISETRKNLLDRTCIKDDRRHFLNLWGTPQWEF